MYSCKLLQRLYHQQYSENLHFCCSVNYTILHLDVRDIEFDWTSSLAVRVLWA